MKLLSTKVAIITLTKNARYSIMEIMDCELQFMDWHSSDKLFMLFYGSAAHSSVERKYV